MRILYIRLLSISCALALSGCSELADKLKSRHSLSNRVGNYSPTRLKSDKGEIRAQRQITVLKKGIRDLDGREESYDPAFGSPEKGADANLASKVGSSPPVRARENERAASSQGDRFRTLASGSDNKFNSPNLVASNNFTPLSSAERAQFGLSESGKPAPSFRFTTRTTPILNTPPLSAGNQQGFGCPPSGMTSLNNSIESNPAMNARASSSTIDTGSARQLNGVAAPSVEPPNLTTPMTTLVQPPATDMPSYSSLTTRDGDVVAAQTQRANGVNVLITARVKELLPDDRKGNPHQRFLLDLSNGTTVLVAHNIDLAPYVPLHENDIVTICGEYIWNERGGVIHYTHRATNFKHKGGYIDYNRQIYQ